MKNLIFIAFSVTIFGSCYSFQGISIPPDISTFYVENFEDQSGEAPPEFNVQFSEDLAQKIRDNSRLKIANDNADLFFSGAITQFRIRAEDPNSETGTALNRLYVTVEVKQYNVKTEAEESSRYEEYAEFAPDQDFFDVQESILEEITERLLERIFNDSFTNW